MRPTMAAIAGCHADTDGRAHRLVCADGHIAAVRVGMLRAVRSVARQSNAATLAQMHRDYAAFSSASWPADRTDAMRKFCDIGWEAFHHLGVSWIGFYIR